MALWIVYNLFKKLTRKYVDNVANLDEDDMSIHIFADFC